jgi:hypothetical protein
MRALDSVKKGSRISSSTFRNFRRIKIRTMEALDLG